MCFINKIYAFIVYVLSAVKISPNKVTVKTDLILGCVTQGDSEHYIWVIYSMKNSYGTQNEEDLTLNTVWNYSAIKNIKNRATNQILRNIFLL